LSTYLHENCAVKLM